MHQHISCGAPIFFIGEIMWGSNSEHSEQSEHLEQSEQLGALGATPTIVLTP